MKNRNLIHWLWLGLMICLLDASPANAFYNPQQGAGGVGGLLGVSYYGTATTNCFAAYDGNGNVAALVNANDGTLTANYEYGPFGEVIRMSGVMATVNPFRFSTKYQDNETDLLYYGYRFYNPSQGRWVNRDPIGERGGKNLFTFSGNDLVAWVDILGMKRTCVLLIKAAHGLTDPEGSLISDYKKRDWKQTPCGDGIGYVGCLANQLNASVADKYPNSSIAIPPSDPDPIEQDRLDRANQELEGSGLHLDNGDYQTTDDLVPAYEAARKEAVRRCNGVTCCKKVTVRVRCSSAFAYEEVKGVALTHYSMSGIAPDQYDKWLSKAIKQAYREWPDEILCGKSITYDCETGKWSKLK